MPLNPPSRGRRGAPSRKLASPPNVKTDALLNSDGAANNDKDDDEVDLDSGSDSNNRRSSSSPSLALRHQRKEPQRDQSSSTLEAYQLNTVKAPRTDAASSATASPSSNTSTMKVLRVLDPAVPE